MATHRLISNSPAFNLGPSGGCLDTEGIPVTVDARGATRSGPCDAGAYEAFLAVKKTATGMLLPGGVVTYTLTFDTFGGAGVFSQTVLTDAIPAAVNYIPDSASATTGQVSVSANVLTWTGTVTSSTPPVIQFAAGIPAGAVGVAITNTAQATWSGFQAADGLAVFDTLSRLRVPMLARNSCTDFSDTFSSIHSRWPVGDSDYVTRAYISGEYQVASKQSGYLYIVPAPTCGREAYRLETTARWAGATGSDLGLVFGADPTFSHFYFFDINTDSQSYAVYHFNTDGTVATIAPPTVNSLIHPGTNSNVIELTRNRSTINLLVNGGWLRPGQPWYDTSFMDISYVGLAVSPYANAPVADARFDSFVVQQQPVMAGQGATSEMLEEQRPAAVALPLPRVVP